MNQFDVPFMDRFLWLECYKCHFNRMHGPNMIHVLLVFAALCNSSLREDARFFSNFHTDYA
jgi:hypothetical protein